MYCTKGELFSGSSADDPCTSSGRGLRTMDVQVIHYEHLRRSRVGRYRLLDVAGEVSFGSRRADRGSNQLPGRHLEVADQSSPTTHRRLEGQVRGPREFSGRSGWRRQAFSRTGGRLEVGSWPGSRKADPDQWVCGASCQAFVLIRPWGSSLELVIWSDGHNGGPHPRVKKQRPLPSFGRGAMSRFSRIRNRANNRPGCLADKVCLF